MEYKLEDYEKEVERIGLTISSVTKWQMEVMRIILGDHGSLGGIVCSKVKGENGTYDVETIYNDGKNIMCHLDYPAFEVDVDFIDLSVSERMTILKGVIDFLHLLEQ